MRTVRGETDLASAHRRVPAMRTIDVFNGDADGLCALHQLRLAQPADTNNVHGNSSPVSCARADTDTASNRPRPRATALPNCRNRFMTIIR